jgi:hypothetical protein
MHVSRILSRTLRALRLQLSADSPDQAEIDDRSDDVSNAAVAAARRPTA